MLPKERRLRKGSDFDRVFRQGRVIRRPDLRLVWAEGDGRIGLVVARTVGSNAYRNTVRRRWREALREMTLSERIDVVIVVREQGAKMRGSELRESLRQAVSQLPS